jgi:hypothetical protein
MGDGRVLLLVVPSGQEIGGNAGYRSPRQAGTAALLSAPGRF